MNATALVLHRTGHVVV